MTLRTAYRVEFREQADPQRQPAMEIEFPKTLTGSRALKRIQNRREVSGSWGFRVLRTWAPRLLFGSPARKRGFKNVISLIIEILTANNILRATIRSS